MDTLATWRDRASRTPNPDETLYRQLLGVQCRALSESLPFLFDPQQDYLTLFLPGNLLNQDSIIRRLTNDIPEEDWRDSADSENGVEIIGWLYQFYISERKDEVIGAKSKIAARDIPAATQLFTPHWIVRYMVENSLGRLWLEGHPESGLRSVMKYYLESPPEETPHPLTPSPTVGEGEPETASAPLARSGRGVGGEGIPNQPQELTVLDPACGSGHILVYAFDLLFEIYKEQGYRERDIPALILAHNLHGLDIDERAVQLARFAVLMKARAKNPRFFRKPEQIPRLKIMTVKSTRPLLAGRQVKAQAFPSQQSAQLDLLPNTAPEQLDLATVAPEGTDAGIFSLPQLKREDWLPLLEAFKDADNLGSLITPPKFDAMKLLDQVQKLREENPLFAADAAALEELLEQAELLRRQYWVVVANPPYMGSQKMNSVVRDSADEQPLAKMDLFSLFILRTSRFIYSRSNIGLLTPFVWMFLKSYKSLRKYLLENYSITSLVQLEYNAFEPACVPVCSYTLERKSEIKITGKFVKLSDFKGAEQQEPRLLEAIENKNCNYTFTTFSDKFTRFPEYAIAYWLSDNIEKFFSDSQPLGKLAKVKKGLSSSNNDRFLRLWHEVTFANLVVGCENNQAARKARLKWAPLNKGGTFRKWYGNQDWVIEWVDGGRNLLTCEGAYVRAIDFYFKPSISWTDISSSSFCARFYPEGFIFDATGSSVFVDELGKRLCILSLMNSKLSKPILSDFAPTMHYEVGQVSNLPVPNSWLKDAKIVRDFVSSAIEVSKNDWENFETSWRFQTPPLLRHNIPSLSQAFNTWQQQAETAFQELKRLEEENNRYWIDAYGLQDELTPEVPDDQITIRRADLQRDIKSLISYAVGCMMGRYSLDKPGLIHAGQPFDPSHHQQFPADADAIIPITDQAYFDDDIVSRFVEFIKVAFSPDTLTENLDFIANALTLKSGETALDRIRRYFVNEFISDHIKTYKKRPIYWLFSSGKKRAFGALIYLHRYTPETVGRIRTDYILELQVKLDKESERVQAQADSATTTAAKRAATKRLKTLQDQQLELRDYQARVQTFGDRRIALDLDDGVAYNYTRFQGIIYEGTDLKMTDLEKKAQWKLDLLKAQEVPQ